MLKRLLGAVIGSLVTYNFILPNDDYRETFEDFNTWTKDKIERVLEDPSPLEEAQETAEQAMDEVQNAIDGLN